MANLVARRKIERAKHRLLYSLVRLALPLVTRSENPQTGLAFDVLADTPQPGAPRVMTGHDNGLITMAPRHTMPSASAIGSIYMPYCTVLVHFRHEVGHYFWDRLVKEGGRLEPFRALFGDERADYGHALQSHYEQSARRLAGTLRQRLCNHASLGGFRRRHGRTICTLSTRCKWRTPLASPLDQG